MAAVWIILLLFLLLPAEPLWLVQLVILAYGMEMVRRYEGFAGPVILLTVAALAVHMHDAEVATSLQSQLPRLQDMFTGFVRELRPEDLSGSAGTYQLRATIVDANGNRSTTPNTGSVTVDSTTPLLSWPELFKGREIVLRVDPGFGHGHHEKVRTGGKDAKFGLAAEALPDFLDAARAAGARITGLHAHIGSGIHDARHWHTVYASLAAIASARAASEFGLHCIYEVPADCFLAMELQPGGLAGLQGEVLYHPLFDEESVE